MRYWWVNLGDSYEEARKLGALWAPLKDKRGNPNNSWESLDLVKRGDIVLHYANKKIRAISTVISGSRVAEKTLRDRTQWQDLGREIAVDIQDFDFTIDISEIPSDLRLNSGNGIETPFDRNGKVKQGYLYAAPSEVVKFVFEYLNLLSPNGQGDLDTRASELFGDFSDGTDKAITGTFRREQRALRAHLVQGKDYLACGLCGRELPTSLLVAAHIKPRSSCSEKERVDPNVAMLACVLGCDALFEKGHLFVDENGLVRATEKLQRTSDLDKFINEFVGKRAIAFSEGSRGYFAWHGSNIAGQSNK